MNRRLMHYVVDNYPRDRRILDLVNSTELWFVPVANPDGYDWTFEPRPAAVAQEPARQRRRRRRSPTATAWTRTATSPTSGATTTRAPRTTRRARPTAAPARTPSPRARRSTALVQARRLHRVPRQLPLGRGAAALRRRLAGRRRRRRTTCSASAMAGDDAHPPSRAMTRTSRPSSTRPTARPTRYLHENYGSFGFTPEMSTCEDASNSDPDDEWEAEDCGSGFEFPDDEKLIEAEFEKNIPFALAVAESAEDPDDPVSVGRPQGAGLPRSTRSTSPTATRRRSRSPPSARSRTSSSTTRSTTARPRPRPCPSGRAASATATRTTTTTREFRGEVKGTQAGDQRRRSGSRARRRPPARRRERRVHLHGQAEHGREGARDRRRGLQRASTRRTRPARTRRATRSAPARRSARPATAPTCGTSTSRASRTTSACSATTRRSSGTSATTAITQDPEDELIDTGPIRSASCPTSASPSASST